MLRAMFHGVQEHLIDHLLDGGAIIGKVDVRAFGEKTGRSEGALPIVIEMAVIASAGNDERLINTHLQGRMVEQKDTPCGRLSSFPAVPCFTRLCR